jgi:hypothetical protein
MVMRHRPIVLLQILHLSPTAACRSASHDGTHVACHRRHRRTLGTALLEILDGGKDADAVADGGDAHLLELGLLDIEQHGAGDVVRCKGRRMGAQTQGVQPVANVGLRPAPHWHEHLRQPCSTASTCARRASSLHNTHLPRQ